MNAYTEYVIKCVEKLEKAYYIVKTTDTSSQDYDFQRKVLIREFDNTIEQCGRKLKKRLSPHFGTKKEADVLTFKDLFRHALKYSLVTEEEVVRWMNYRNNRDDRANDNGELFEKGTMSLMETFIKDARHLLLLFEDIESIEYTCIEKIEKPNLNVKPEYLAMLIDIFKSYCPKAEIWAYGSRLKGTSHEGSDLDLTIKSFNDDTRSLWSLSRLINNSNVPFIVDINKYEDQTEIFKQQVLKLYVVIYDGNQ